MPVPAPPDTEKVVLHLEDSDDFAALVKAFLDESNFVVHRSRTLAEAEDAAAGTDFACAFVDLDLPDAGGLQAVMGLRSVSPELPLVVLSGQEIDTGPIKAVLLGAQDWVGKHEVSADRLTSAATLAMARQDAQAKQLWRAAHDQATGLPNRTLALEHLSRAVARASRRSGEVAVLFCDLDGFKAINDEHGHAAGDSMLGAVAHRLIATLRPGDVVARWGGDEFLVIAENVDSVDQAVTIGQRVREHVGEPLDLEGATVRPSVSVGIAVTPGIHTARALIEAADQAMLHAKRTATGLHVL